MVREHRLQFMIMSMRCTSAMLALMAALSPSWCAAQPTPWRFPGTTPDLDTCWARLDAKAYDACARCIADVEKRIAMAAPDERTATDLLTLKGAHAYATGDAEMAERSLLLALPKYHAIGSPGKLGSRIYRTLGHIDYEQGDYHRGLEYYRTLLGILLQPDLCDDQYVGRVQYNIGNCFWGLDQRDSCKVHYAIALALWESGDVSRNPVISYIHEVLGTYAWEAGDERAALEHFNIAAAHQLKQASGLDEADQLVKAAEHDAGQGRMDQALQRYEQALDFRVKNYGDAHPNTACMHSDIARMLLAMGRPDEAMVRVQEAIARFIPGYVPSDAWSDPVNIDGTTSERLLLDALLLRFRLLRERPQDERAAQACDKVVDLAMLTIERLRTGANSEGSKLFWTTQVRGFFEDALDHCHSRFQATGDARMIERSLSVMEMSKNALLADALRSLDALSSAGLPPAIAEEERALRSRIADMRRYILLEEKKCARMDVDKVALWKKALIAGEAELGLLVERISNEYPAYHDLKYGSTAVHLDDVRQRLGADRSLLCMFQGSAACYFILLDERGPQFVKDGRVEHIANAVTSLRKALADHALALAEPQRAYDSLTQHARSLFAAIFGGFGRPPLEQLVIMPDGQFQSLPFDVLLTREPAAGGRNYQALPYLIKEHVVQYIPMIRTWLNEPANDGHSAYYLGVAARYGNEGTSGLAPLRYNNEEVRSAVTLLGGTVLSGAEATERNFRKHVREADVIHMAMHTVIDDTDPLYTAFVFTDDPDRGTDALNDGRLNMHELFGMDLSARLAVLSGCRTGDGKMLHGEGAMSMARAFAHAGCPSMLMSLWNCEDEATRTIITAFFSAAKDGAALDRALRTAKLDHLAGCDPMKAHPYYWSTMLLVGDEHEIDLSGPWYRRAWAWIAAACLVVLLLARSRIAKLF